VLQSEFPAEMAAACEGLGAEKGEPEQEGRKEARRGRNQCYGRSYPRPGGQLPLFYLKPAQGVLMSLANEHQPW